MDDDDYDTREKAEAELLKVGFAAESALLQAQEAKSAEVRIRVRRVLQTLRTKPGISLSLRQTRAAAFSPDGKTLVCGGTDGEVRWYAAASGKLLGK